MLIRPCLTVNWNNYIQVEKPGVLTIDKLCDHLEITVRPFAICCVNKGERLVLGPRDEATVHYVIAGRGTLSFTDSSDFDIEPGSTIVAPAGLRHEVTGWGNLREIPDMVRDCRPLAMGLTEVGRRTGELKGGIAILCGTVDVSYHHLNDVFHYLPAPIVVQAHPDDAIGRAFREIMREMAAPQPGTRAMLRALFQQCFIELLRRHSTGTDTALTWLSALQDPRLGRVVNEIIEDPGQPYTLDLLAGKCAMSRSTFSEHFHEVFGRPAMDFVREVRLRSAARLLRQTRDPIKTIAARMGYASRSNFNHAFKEFFRTTPAEYRAAESVPET